MCCVSSSARLITLERDKYHGCWKLIISEVTELLFFRRRSAIFFEIKVIEDQWGLLVWWFPEYLQKTNKKAAAD
jgi:hypothetical protein